MHDDVNPFSSLPPSQHRPHFRTSSAYLTGADSIKLIQLKPTAL